MLFNLCMSIGRRRLSSVAFQSRRVISTSDQVYASVCQYFSRLRGLGDVLEGAKVDVHAVCLRECYGRFTMSRLKR